MTLHELERDLHEAVTAGRRAHQSAVRASGAAPVNEVAAHVRASLAALEQASKSLAEIAELAASH